MSISMGSTGEGVVQTGVWDIICHSIPTHRTSARENRWRRLALTAFDWKYTGLMIAISYRNSISIKLPLSHASPNRRPLAASSHPARVPKLKYSLQGVNY
jgi:hypothetical protein